jgi:hypothetical protein
MVPGGWEGPQIENKMFFSRISKPISLVNGNHSCTIKVAGPLQRGDNHKKCKNGMGSFKFFFSELPLTQNGSYLHENFLI